MGVAPIYQMHYYLSPTIRSSLLCKATKVERSFQSFNLLVSHVEVALLLVE